jgi:hypothetical protein
MYIVYHLFFQAVRKWVRKYQRTCTIRISLKAPKLKENKKWKRRMEKEEKKNRKNENEFTFK